VGIHHSHHLLERFADRYNADIIIATHTGLPWARALSNNRLFVNCGVLGRPANDGTTRVGYTILDAGDPKSLRTCRWNTITARWPLK